MLVGAGHAHVELVRLLGTNKPRDTQITLISESPRAGYSGMMPGVIAGHYHRDEAEIDVPGLCARAGIAFASDTLVRIDADAQLVVTESGSFEYHWLSLNTGSQPWLPEQRRGLHLGVKPFSAFLDALPQLAFAQRIAVVGGGAAAIEVLLALRHRFGEHHAFTLVCAEEALLPRYPQGVLERVLKTLHANQIKIVLNARVNAASETGLTLQDGSHIACDASVWATGARPHAYVAKSNLASAADGFIAVNSSQQSVSHANVFAVGDCATLESSALPKAGVVPVRQGPWLHAQLMRALVDEPIMPFENKRTALALLALGGKQCVGHKGDFIFHGAWAWWMKDYIDRRFMAKYQ